jgi:LacI family transcriptional regulator
VIKVAKALGYERDPMLGALAAYRRELKSEQFHGMLAWVFNSANGFGFNRAEEHQLYYSGACERASQLGYQVDPIDLAAYPSNPRHVSSVCLARGIRGVFVGPQPMANAVIGMDFSHIASVAMGYTAGNPELHSVVVDEYDSMRKIVQRLHDYGYRRVGYAIPRKSNERARRMPLAGFLAEQAGLDRNKPLPIYDEQPRADSFSSWLKRYRPDAIVTTRYALPVLLQQLGLKVPADLGVALVSLGEGDHMFSGINESSRVVGQVAAEFLISLVEHGQFGVPKHPRRVVIKGCWRDGASLRRQSRVGS